MDTKIVGVRTESSQLKGKPFQDFPSVFPVFGGSGVALSPAAVVDASFFAMTSARPKFFHSSRSMRPLHRAARSAKHNKQR